MKELKNKFAWKYFHRQAGHYYHTSEYRDKDISECLFIALHLK